MSRATVVLWDIDGTLLTTLKAGIKAWEDAAREILGVDFDLENMPTSGLTDPMIAREILTMAGRGPDHELESALGAVYVDALPQRLTERPGFALPGVVDVLDALHSRGDVLQGLLTGNYRRGAKAKLEHYRLSRYFEFGGFGDDGFERSTIGRLALQRASNRGGDTRDGQVFLVGDSPYDVACANALAMRMIAVTTGAHTRQDLGEGSPWWLLEQLPSPEDFLSHIGLARS